MMAEKKNSWIELMETFYKSLKAVFGLKENQCYPVLFSNGQILLTEKHDILSVF